MANDKPDYYPPPGGNHGPFNSGVPGVHGSGLSPKQANKPTQLTAQAAPPAGIIGTAKRGPAFVPMVIGGLSDFEVIFGDTKEQLGEAPTENGYFDVANPDIQRYTIKNQGPFAAKQWFDNGGQTVVYVRTLGAGNCRGRTTQGGNEGRIENAGFVVGQEIINTGTNVIGPNPYAGSTSTTPGAPGRAYFLAALMSESNGSTIFSDAGIQKSGENIAHPILRGVLFAPSGVVLSLSSNLEPNNVATTTAAKGTFGTSNDGGCPIGTVDIWDAKERFVMILNGHKNTDEYPNVITASFNLNAKASVGLGFQPPLKSIYFGDVFNTDPAKIQQAGHYLHTHYEIPSTFTQLTGSGIVDNTLTFPGDGLEPLAFLLTSSVVHNTGTITIASDGTVGVPNFENFQDRFSGGFSPFVVSQKIGGKNYDLFRFHTINQGESAVSEMKITIRDILPPDGPDDKFCKFSIDVRGGFDSEQAQQFLHTFPDVDLNPNSDRYIAKIIGDQNTFYDFDASNTGRKIVVEGDYPLQTQLLRVEISAAVKKAEFPNALPVGFRGIYHLVTSGSANTGAILTGSLSSAASLTNLQAGISTDILQRVVQPPLSLRERLGDWYAPTIIGTGQVKSPSMALVPPWGMQYERKSHPERLNAESKLAIGNINQLVFFPHFHTSLQNPWVGDNHGTADIGGCVLDADRFNNNFFTLEKIAVITGSTTNNRSEELPDPSEWLAARYIRNGKLPSELYKKTAGATSDKVRFVDPEKDLHDDESRPYLRFTLPIMGGFDGLNIFNKEKASMTDVAIRRERDDASQAGKKDCTTAAYLESLEILKSKTTNDMQLLCIPGISHPAITNPAIGVCEEKNNALFLMEIEKYDDTNTPVTGVIQDLGYNTLGLTNTITRFEQRVIGSSYVAAYFPSVLIDYESKERKLSATAAALGAIARNDTATGVHAGPIGPKRSTILGSTQVNVDLDSIDSKRMIAVNINPIKSVVPNTDDSAAYLYSQKTTVVNPGGKKENGLDRISTRRLMLDIRRSIRNIARLYLFDAASTATVQKFRVEAKNYLNGLQADNVIGDYKIVLDEATMASMTTVNPTLAAALNSSQNPRMQNTTSKLGIEFNTIRGVLFIKLATSEVVVRIEFDNNEDL